MNRWLKEPLLHFLLLGAGLFLAYRLMARTAGTGEPGEIVVTQGQIEHLAAGFAKTWQRPPTREELAGLVRDRVREEVYCREAIAMGLDKDDTVIRRRLRQKMEFISDDISAQAEPNDAELNTYLQAHPSAFRLPPRFTFRQVYLNPKRRGGRLTRDAAELLALLNRSGRPTDISSAGDPLMLDSEFANFSSDEIAKLFGDEFSTTLNGLSSGRWHGPIESGYGVHLVFVSEHTEGHMPALAEVRDAVLREWSSARRLEANRKFYQELLKRYTVTIEPIELLEGGKELAQAK